MSYTVYELYSSNNVLLYVGKTENFPNRLKQHSNGKAWYPLISNIRITNYLDSERATVEEQFKINTWKPLFNIEHNTLNRKDLDQMNVKLFRLYENTFGSFSSDQTFIRVKLFEIMVLFYKDLSYTSEFYNELYESYIEFNDRFELFDFD